MTKIGKNGKVIKHKHVNSEEIYFFTKGSATMIINDEKIDVAEGDFLQINVNDVHELYTSEQETVEFYAITVPPYVKEDFIVV